MDNFKTLNEMAPFLTYISDESLLNAEQLKVLRQNQALLLRKAVQKRKQRYSEKILLATVKTSFKNFLKHLKQNERYFVPKLLVVRNVELAAQLYQIAPHYFDTVSDNHKTLICDAVSELKIKQQLAAIVKLAA
jgi:hypothetical protein